jgi:DNA repair exonuclease SbcCD ATPase subunit
MNNRDKIKWLRLHIDKKTGLVEGLKEQNEKKIAENKVLEQEFYLHEKALTIIKEVGRKTQEKLQFHISDITSLALDAVMPEDPYKLTMEFVDRRDKNECDLRFERQGNLMKPLDSSGVGAIDVASFALRIAAWSIQFPKSRPVIILDEPFKFLDKSKHGRASEMLKELSLKLGLQFIIVTHEEGLTENADRIFKVSNIKRTSKVEQV